jgi:hypothetical protein
MRHAVSFLILIVLIAPMVRDCCLPVIHNLPCHESKHADDEACFWSQQAIPQAKGTIAYQMTVEYRLPSIVLFSQYLTTIRYFANRVLLLARQDGTDLYLRTGALLI